MDELRTLMKDLDAGFFKYAHLTGALELYMMVFEIPNLQQAFSRTISESEIVWKQIYCFMVIDDEVIRWYPELPVQTIPDQRNVLLGFLYGITLSRMIRDLDFYFSSILKNHFGHFEISGSFWNPFIQKMALLQNSPFRNPTDKKSLKNKDNFLKKSPNLPFRNSAFICYKENKK